MGVFCHVESSHSSLVTSGGTSGYCGILDPSRSTIELPGSGPTGAMGQALGVWHCGLDMKGLGRKTIKGNSKRSESLRRNSSVFGCIWQILAVFLVLLAWEAESNQVLQLLCRGLTELSFLSQVVPPPNTNYGSDLSAWLPHYFWRQVPRQQVGLSENGLNPIVPIGFADQLSRF